MARFDVWPAGLELQGDWYGRTIPAIALTAHARIEDRVQALSAGYDTHIAKPFEPRDIRAVVLKTRMAQQRPLEILDIRAVGRDWRITARPQRLMVAEK